MKLVNQSVYILDLGAWNGDEILQKLELAGRLAYRSEDKITSTSAATFVKMLVKSGHHSVIEHHTVSVKFTTSRSVTHELVRHRLSSFTQSSQRYIKYDDVEFIYPVNWMNYTEEQQNLFIRSCEQSEKNYRELMICGLHQEEAREALINACSTEIVHTANLREWRHILELRCSIKAHPQIRDLSRKCLKLLSNTIPIIFDDLKEKYLK